MSGLPVIRQPSSMMFGLCEQSRSRSLPMPPLNLQFGLISSQLTRSNLTLPHTSLGIICSLLT